MKKAKHYKILKSAGLPTPIFDVFDQDSLKKGGKRRLKELVLMIKEKGSGLIGVRTEPKSNLSLLGSYPHYMPLKSFEEVLEKINENEVRHPDIIWWYLVNEAFVSYGWNAAISVTEKFYKPGGPRLYGEVNLIDDMPLRDALNNTSNLTPANEWYEHWPMLIRKMILRSGLVETCLEISLVKDKNTERLIFWGIR